MITTKRGKKRNGIGVDYSYKYKMITPYRYRDVQNKYGAGGPITLSEPGFPTNAAGDTLLYPGVYSTDNLVLNQEGETTSSNEEFGYYGDAVSWGPEMNGEMVQWWDGKMRPYSAQPDNQELMFHNGSTSTHNLAFSGGGEMGTIRVSLTRMDHKPIVDNSKLNQTTINLGARLNISKKVKADISFSYFDYYRLIAL